MLQVEMCAEVQRSDFSMRLYRLVTENQKIVGRLSLVDFDVPSVSVPRWSYVDSIVVRDFCRGRGYGREAVRWINHKLEQDKQPGLLWDGCPNKIKGMYARHGWLPLKGPQIDHHSYFYYLSRQILNSTDIVAAYIHHRKQVNSMEVARPGSFYDFDSELFNF